MADKTPAADFPSGVVPFSQRRFPKRICMFDVDETLGKARALAKPEMLERLKKLRETCAIAYVGGSNLVKQQEQLGSDGKSLSDLSQIVFR